MIITDLKLLKGNHSRLIGLDIGEKTIGIAFSDLLWLSATGQNTLNRKTMNYDTDYLLALYDKEKACCFVMGYPLNMNGSQGPSCKRVMDLVEALCEKRDIPIFLWDERLSTTAVTRTLLEADVSRKKRAQVVDKLAASFILQGVLDLVSQN